MNTMILNNKPKLNNAVTTVNDVVSDVDIFESDTEYNANIRTDGIYYLCIDGNPPPSLKINHFYEKYDVKNMNVEKILNIDYEINVLSNPFSNFASRLFITDENNSILYRSPEFDYDSTTTPSLNKIVYKATNLRIPENSYQVFIGISTPEGADGKIFKHKLTNAIASSKLINNNNNVYDVVTCNFESAFKDSNGIQQDITQIEADIQTLQTTKVNLNGNNTITGQTDFIGDINLNGNLALSDNKYVLVSSSEGLGRISSGDGAFFIESNVNTNGVIKFSYMDESVGPMTIITKSGSEAVIIDSVLNLNNTVQLGNMPFDANNNWIENLKYPSQNSHATSKQYVDDMLATKLDLSGGTMTGPINMNNNFINGLALNPTSDHQAVPKKYVDDLIVSPIKKIKTHSFTFTPTKSSNTETDNIYVFTGNEFDLDGSKYKISLNMVASSAITVGSGDSWTMILNTHPMAGKGGATGYNKNASLYGEFPISANQPLNITIFNNCSGGYQDTSYNCLLTITPIEEF
jgi:hypothetical protein